jgi:hypothetical protein
MQRGSIVGARTSQLPQLRDIRRNLLRLAKA